ncbi:GIY-YIG nuclease family protein [Sinanaerobacter chloroacetimidivorans]|uniref:GIY-YIG nuclease family protein n=1 Tax=Sinanaerobacter chloroacetimidivorans TaxID=2818044 RepID=A0A8J7W4S9_9FIRM|nr:GIY-YIG nuclease family protein [Sinanaerobacter chloroacetimidivorans]MBR0599103.1 GIY-YIG nuclease family protein [Sinanaerobacter chloroacetimidivorans]
MGIERERKKEIISEYKQKKTTGGVYKITNMANGRYLLKAEVDLQSFQNRYNFNQRVKGCLHPKMQGDYNQYGSEVFSLEFLEEVEKKEDESNMGFKDRLKRLEEAWAAKFDPDKAY